MNRFSIFSIILIIIFQSCKPSDNYTDLSENAKEFLQFEIGDSFLLTNLVTDEIIELNITFKEIDYIDGSASNTGTFLDYGGDSFYEQGLYLFSDQSNCYKGNLKIEARSGDEFEFSITLQDCFGENLTTFNINNFEFEHDGETTSISINGVDYPETYILNTVNNTSLDNTIFYSKENGIIQIDDNINQLTVFEIAE